jgi:ribosomal protein S18 acetylase RimI-like enzyme
MKNIILQRATEKDVEDFLAVEKTAVGKKTYSCIVDEKKAKEEIEKKVVYLIKADGEIVGSIEYGTENDGSAYCCGLVVKTEFQGQGIAREAVRQLLEIIGADKKVHLVTHPHNIPAIKIYLSFGFVIEGWKENYFGDGEPRIVMVRQK